MDRVRTSMPCIVSKGPRRFRVDGLGFYGGMLGLSMDNGKEY